ncbi:MAG TPA: GntR family transcriptional regulator [Mycobacteriales bacterium]
MPRSKTAYEHVRRAVRDAILDGELVGGTRLIQGELAAQFGVSTTPVREALRELATEGLVFFDPHRGAVVRKLELAEVREIYELRMTLEPLLVRRSIDGLTEDRLREAEELLARMEKEEDIHTWADLNRDFHATLMQSADGTRLAGILTGLRDSASAYVMLSLRARSEQVSEANVEHRQLLDLYRQRDTEAAVDLTVAHLRSTLAAIESSADV